jgi:hypothetical protein
LDLKAGNRAGKYQERDKLLGLLFDRARVATPESV